MIVVSQLDSEQIVPDTMKCSVTTAAVQLCSCTAGADLTVQLIKFKDTQVQEAHVVPGIEYTIIQTCSSYSQTINGILEISFNSVFST